MQNASYIFCWQPHLSYPGISFEEFTGRCALLTQERETETEPSLLRFCWVTQVTFKYSPLLAGSSVFSSARSVISWLSVFKRPIFYFSCHLSQSPPLWVYVCFQIFVGFQEKAEVNLCLSLSRSLHNDIFCVFWTQDVSASLSASLLPWLLGKFPLRISQDTSEMASQLSKQSCLTLLESLAELSHAFHRMWIIATRRSRSLFCWCHGS